MASGVIAAVEIWDGRGGALDFPRKRTYTRVFQVRTISSKVGPAAVGNSLGFRMGSRHPEDPVAVCVSIKPTQSTDDPTLWMVEVSYDSEPNFPEQEQPNKEQSEEKPEEAPDNPLNRPAVWKYSYQQTTRAERTAQGWIIDPFDKRYGQLTGFSVPIRNSAGLPYDPPITTEVSRPLITVTRNRPTAWFNHRRIDDLQDAVNKKEWWNFNPRCVRCIGIEASSGRENGVGFWAVSYTFALKYDTWDIRALDAGYTEILPAEPPSAGNGWVGTDARLSKITDSWAREATEPVPLNGHGRKKAPGDPEVYNIFRIYRERDFNALVV